MTTQSPTPPKTTDSAKHKSGRARKTRAEKEAARLAELNKPLDPRLWLLIGVMLLIIAACIFFDPIGFATAGQSSTNGMWIRDMLVILVGIMGKNPTALILGGLALGSLGWGLRSAWQQRNNSETRESSEEAAS